MDKRKEEIKEVICGGARGADSYGETWAISNQIPIKYMLADWEKLGKAAGFIRNHQMGDYADELIAFWDGESSGTKDMIDYMNSLNKPVQIVEI